MKHAAPSDLTARRQRPPPRRLPRFALGPGRLQGRIQDVDRRAAGLRLGQGRRDLPHPGARAHRRAASTSSSTPGASLVQGQQDREFSAMRQGVIDVLCGAPINWTGTVPQLGVFTLPFLLPDHKAWDAVMASEAVMRDYFELVRKAGAEPLSIGETGYRQISNSKRPLLKPDDLKGIKVRVVGSPMYGEIMSVDGREPDLHELGRCAAGARLGRGRCAGEPARGVPRREDPHARPEVRDQVELLERHPAVRDRRRRCGRAGRRPTRRSCARRRSMPRSSRSRWCASSSPRTWSVSRHSASTCTCRRRRDGGLADRGAPAVCALEGADPAALVSKIEEIVAKTRKA